MTAEPYAAATGLIERFAAAYSSAVPTTPRDDGFFGPASVTWRVSADLSAPDADRYVGEMTVAAELLGVPREVIPPDVAALERYMTAVRPQLRRTPAAAEVMAWLLDPPGMEEEVAELWQPIGDAAVTALPDWARDMYGCPAPARLTPERRIQIRQALGVLDAAILGQRRR